MAQATAVLLLLLLLQQALSTGNVDSKLKVPTYK